MDADREIFIFSVQLTKSRIDNLTQLILTLAICDDYTYIYTYIHTYIQTLVVHDPARVQLIE